MDAIRTPDEVLQGLPDFPFEPHYREVDGLRLAQGVLERRLRGRSGAQVPGQPTAGLVFLFKHR